MLRTCDGTDTLLVRETGPRFDDVEPCTCGLTFDDVERSTVWPHRTFTPLVQVAPGVWARVDDATLTELVREVLAT